jgi:hypothetical protein
MGLDMKTLYVYEREEWRQWLAEHHDAEDEVWLIYYRKERANRASSTTPSRRRSASAGSIASEEDRRGAVCATVLAAKEGQ